MNRTMKLQGRNLCAGALVALSLLFVFFFLPSGAFASDTKAQEADLYTGKGTFTLPQSTPIELEKITFTPPLPEGAKLGSPLPELLVLRNQRIDTRTYEVPIVFSDGSKKNVSVKGTFTRSQWTEFNEAENAIVNPIFAYSDETVQEKEGFYGKFYTFEKPVPDGTWVPTWFDLSNLVGTPRFARAEFPDGSQTPRRLNIRALAMNRATAPRAAIYATYQGGSLTIGDLPALPVQVTQLYNNPYHKIDPVNEPEFIKTPFSDMKFTADDPQNNSYLNITDGLLMLAHANPKMPYEYEFAFDELPENIGYTLTESTENRNYNATYYQTEFTAPKYTFEFYQIAVPKVTTVWKDNVTPAERPTITAQFGAHDLTLSKKDGTIVYRSDLIDNYPDAAEQGITGIDKEELKITSLEEEESFTLSIGENTEGILVQDDTLYRYTISGNNNEGFTITLQDSQPKAQDISVVAGEEPDAKEGIQDADSFPEGTTFAFESPVDTSEAGTISATVLVTIPGNEPIAVPVNIQVNPLPESQTIVVPKNGTANAEDGIKNKADFPDGTTFAFTQSADGTLPIDTSKPQKTATVVTATYPNGDTRAVPVLVHVLSDAESYNGQGETSVIRGQQPQKDAISFAPALPEGATITGIPSVDTSTLGDVYMSVPVTFADDSKKSVNVKVTVIENDADKNEPTGKQLEVDPGVVPAAEDAIANKESLPEGTSFSFDTLEDTTTPGCKAGLVRISYPDGSTDFAAVVVKSVQEPLTYSGEGAVTVNQNEQPAKENITFSPTLPEGSTVGALPYVDTALPGEKTMVVPVTLSDGTIQNVTVTVTITDTSTMADNNTPEPTTITVEQDETPDAAKTISNMADLPEGTKAAFAEPLDTSKPGAHCAEVTVTYPDGSQDTVYATIMVNAPEETPTDASQHPAIPQAIQLTVGDTFNPEDGIANLSSLPEGTSVTTQDTVDTSKAGSTKVLLQVTYPDKSVATVSTIVTVAEKPQECPECPECPDDADKKPVDPTGDSTSSGSSPAPSTGTTTESPSYHTYTQQAYYGAIPKTDDRSTALPTLVLGGVGILLGILGFNVRRSAEH